MVGNIQIIALQNMPEITPSTDLANEISLSANATFGGIQDGDIVVITQKIVSKSENMIVDIREIIPSDEAIDIAKRTRKDPRLVQLILDQSKNIIRIDADRSILITETIHGFICANAGIDSSNVSGNYNVALLPSDPNESAKKINLQLRAIFDIKKLGIIITDTFGRPWREGQLSFAIGSFGISPLKNYSGTVDQHGKILKVTSSPVIDVLATSAELVSGKATGTPVSVIRGYDFEASESDASIILRPVEKDLFR